MTGSDRGRRTNYPLSFNEAAFAVTARAIERLSVRNKKYESISTVVSYVCQTYETIPQSAFNDLLALGAVKGDIKVYLKIASDELACFEHFRGQLTDTLGPEFRVAEAVVLCCLILSPQNQRVAIDEA